MLTYVRIRALTPLLILARRRAPGDPPRRCAAQLVACSSANLPSSRPRLSPSLLTRTASSARQVHGTLACLHPSLPHTRIHRIRGGFLSHTSVQRLNGNQDILSSRIPYLGFQWVFFSHCSKRGESLLRACVRLRGRGWGWEWGVDVNSTRHLSPAS